LLWWTLRDIHPGELAEHFGRANPWLLVATAVAATLTFVVRTIRWRYILRLDDRPLPFAPLWHATAIGFMANNILPARSGEVARAFAAHKMTSVSFPAAAATIGVARVMDGLTVTAFLIIAAIAGGFTRSTQIGPLNLGHLMTGTSLVFLVALAVAVFAVHNPTPALALADRMARVLPEKWRGAPVRILRGVLDGLEVLRDWRRFAIVTAWSFGVWTVNGMSFLFGLMAFHVDVPVSAAFVLQSLIAYGVAIPSSPGFFGPFEAVARATLALYGVAAVNAVSFAVGYHLVTFFPITFLGIWSLSRAHLHLTDLRRANPPPITAPASDG
jgi:hypothetical protein